MVEWLVIVYDKPGTDRLTYRQQHLAAIPQAFESGKVTNAGAIYKELDSDGNPQGFAGSSFNLIADSQEEVLEFLKQDVYAKQGIWDLDNVVMYPYGCAARVKK